MLTDIEKEKKMFIMTELGGQIVVLRNKMMTICTCRSNPLEMKGGSDDTRTSSDESDDGYQTSVCLSVTLSIGNKLLSSGLHDIFIKLFLPVSNV
jgi:hypothetical protein